MFSSTRSHESIIDSQRSRLTSPRLRRLSAALGLSVGISFLAACSQEDPKITGEISAASIAADSSRAAASAAASQSAAEASSSAAASLSSAEASVSSAAASLSSAEASASSASAAASSSESAVSSSSSAAASSSSAPASATTTSHTINPDCSLAPDACTPSGQPVYNSPFRGAYALNAVSAGDPNTGLRHPNSGAETLFCKGFGQFSDFVMGYGDSSWMDTSQAATFYAEAGPFGDSVGSLPDCTKQQDYSGNFYYGQ